MLVLQGAGRQLFAHYCHCEEGPHAPTWQSRDVRQGVPCRCTAIAASLATLAPRNDRRGADARAAYSPTPQAGYRRTYRGTSNLSPAAFSDW